MKKFNQEINIKISVDYIARKLLDTMCVDYAHKELVTELIVTNMIDSGTISALFSGLHGFLGEVDFQEGQFLLLEEHGYSKYDPEKDIVHSTTKYVKQFAKVLEVNPLKAKQKLKVQIIDFDFQNSKLEYGKEDWVNHTMVTRLSSEEELMDILSRHSTSSAETSFQPAPHLD